MQIINVQYRTSRDPETFGNRSYSYYCPFEVQVGDIIGVPVRDGISVAKVSEINVPKSKIDIRVEANLKIIETLYTKEYFDEIDNKKEKNDE